MGRIKPKLVKSLTNEVFERFGDQFTTDFAENKVIINKSAEPKLSKKMRNVVAGYAVRLKKVQIKNAL
jgi:ribosomal protein S17E